MYQSTITVNFDERLERLFASEEKTFGRSSYSIEKSNEQLIFRIQAQDTTALKIAINTIIKTLTIWEKTQEI